jgi:hypothetical protein
VAEVRELLKTCVFALVPSSTREKFASGGEGVAVKLKLVGPSGMASLMMVIEPGKTTASLESERSWLPPEPSSPSNRMWYGEPEMVTAELVEPQSWRVEMWPPQASTGLLVVAVNVSVSCADVSPAKPGPGVYV